MSNIIKLSEGDLRCESLLEALKAVVYERGVDMPIPSIIGILELLKFEIIKEQS